MDKQIDENLRRVYDDVLNEAVPDKFLHLIEQLKGADAARRTDPKAPDDA
ncbi:MAG: NepR family anti-sigma factor [Roseicyclus sp.]